MCLLLVRLSSGTRWLIHFISKEKHSNLAKEIWVCDLCLFYLIMSSRLNPWQISFISICEKSKNSKSTSTLSISLVLQIHSVDWQTWIVRQINTFPSDFCECAFFFFFKLDTQLFFQFWYWQRGHLLHQSCTN